MQQPVPELGILRFQSGVFLEELLASGTAAVLGRDGGHDLLGVVVNALAATTALLGLLCGRPAMARQASRGIGAPTANRYGEHGDGSSRVGFGSTTAPLRSILQGLKRGLVESCQVSTWKRHFNPVLGRSPPS